MTLILKFLVLFVFWVCLSGKLDAFHLGLGIVTAVLVLALEKYRSKSSAKAFSFKSLFDSTFQALGYGIWLLSRIFLAAFHVSKLILHPSLPIAPKMIRHKTSLKQDTAKVIFANSITLTPGTITAELSGNELIVHQLDDSSSCDIESGLMEKNIGKIFTQGKNP